MSYKGRNIAVRMNNMDYKFFIKARQTAMISDYPRIHIGCVAAYHGNIIGIGCNSNKTHPIQDFYNKYRIKSDKLLPKIHAEINCLNSIRSLDINFAKVKLYIYRICKDRPCGIARPCPSCMAMIKDLGIKNIYYTTNNGYAHEKIKRYKNGDVA